MIDEATFYMKKIPIVLFLIFLPLKFVQSAQIFVDPAKGANVPQADLDATTTLVQSAVQQIGNYDLANNVSDAEFTLRPELLRLGKSYILKISKVKSNTVISTGQLKAENIEELDKVALRVTQSILKDRNASDDAQVGEMTNQESLEGTQRRPVRHLTYLGFGGSMFENLNSSSLGYSLGFGKGWDSNKMLIKIMGNLSGVSNAGFISATIGLDYFLSMHDLAPYLGGNFGYGAAKTIGSFFDASARGGFVVAPEAGFQILRTTAVCLDIGLRAELLLNSNEFGNPMAYSLRVGVYY